MKLLRYGNKGAERPGVLDEEGNIRDLSGLVDDLSGSALLPASLEKLKSHDLSSLPTVEGDPRLGPCVAAVGKFICIGLNYSDHAAESGMAVPAEPVLFMKATSSLSGPASATAAAATTPLSTPVAMIAVDTIAACVSAVGWS